MLAGHTSLAVDTGGGAEEALRRGREEQREEQEQRRTLLQPTVHGQCTRSARAVHGIVHAQHGYGTGTAAVHTGESARRSALIHRPPAARRYSTGQG